MKSFSVTFAHEATNEVFLTLLSAIDNSNCVTPIWSLR